MFSPPLIHNVPPDGIQDEDNVYKEETSHVRSMTDKCTAKAEKPRGSARTGAAEGTLGRQSVAKLNSMVNRLKATICTMENQLASATTSPYIAHQLIAKLASVKSELHADMGCLLLYKENNREDNTDIHIEHSQAMLNSAVQEFTVLKKLLKAEEKSKLSDGCVPEVI